MKTAIELIADERKRQIEVEGYSLHHDDEHASGELAMAAMCYCLDPVWRPKGMAPLGWPWVGGGDMDGFKPDNDRIRELVKAGALITAEIERLQRLKIDANDEPVKQTPRHTCGKDAPVTDINEEKKANISAAAKAQLIR